MIARRQISSATTDGGEVADRRALVELFEADFDDVYRFCLARTADRATAEDVASEVFLAAARTLAAGKREIDRAWLFVVARNQLVDQWRRGERQRRRLEKLVAVRPEPDRDPSDIDWIAENVIEVLRELPERQRAALALRYLDGFSVGRVSVELDIEYTAAESLLARARRNFSARWKERDERHD